MKMKFTLGLVVGSAVGYVASKYLTSEDGQKVIENIKEIRADFNNGGVGLANRDELVSSFNERTGALKDYMKSSVSDLDTSDIVFNEDDIKK
ncbi:hypothetical protein [Companilactobacillus metriopterae]|uniref:hypothetical protein n=1 Tax=Companilactobacillus metriopterae TaxID=1909267 RepID=UPI00100A76EA|nr:hypothetical protein [Companilactobacillus metriopterae]